MTKNEICEADGRSRLLSFLELVKASDIRETTRYSTLDMYAKLKGKDCCFEVKVRDLIDKRTGQLYDEIFLSVNKILEIREKVKNEGFAAGFYFCFFRNEVYIFDVLNVKKRYGRRTLKASTYEGYLGYMDRDLAYMKRTDAIHLEYLGGEWKRCQQ